MLLDFDLTDATDKAEIDKIEMLFAASLTDYPSHIVKVANIADLDELVATGRLIDENAEPSSPDSFSPLSKGSSAMMCFGLVKTTRPIATIRAVQSLRQPRLAQS